MKRYLGTLTGEDLARYRQVYTKRLSVDMNPHAYSAHETEMAIQQHWKLFAEIRGRFELPEDDLGILTIEPVTGQVYLADD